MAIGEYSGPPRLDMIINYAFARYLENQREQVYRMYVTESLRLAPQGMYLTQSYNDLITPKKPIDGEAIIKDVIERAGVIIK